MKVPAHQTIEEFIRDDASKVFEQRVRLPKLAYLVNPDDMRKICLRSGSQAVDCERMTLHTPAGYVTVVKDLYHPVGETHRLTVCPCGNLTLYRSTVEKCPGCMQSVAYSYTGTFRIEPDPPDLAERRADRIAGHQRAEAMRSGWTGDSWVACGCATPGECPKATCTNHRLAPRCVGPRLTKSLRDCATAAAKAQQSAAMRMAALRPDATLSARLGHLKHGPGGSGLEGPCDVDCLKCAVENVAKARFWHLAMPVGDPEFKREYSGLWVDPPVDPLDVAYDGVKLRELLEIDARRRDERNPYRTLTPAQRAAVSVHWSAELHAKVAASAAADKEREQRRVLIDLDPE